MPVYWHEIDFMGFTEIRMDFQHIFSLPQYDMFCNNRNTRGGGGLMCIKSHFNAKMMSDILFMEAFIIEI